MDSKGDHRIAEEQVRVVVADDHSVLRAGLCMLLNAEPDFQVVGDAGNGAGALELVKDLSPDILLLDIGMPGMSGVPSHP